MPLLHRQEGGIKRGRIQVVSKLGHHAEVHSALLLISVIHPLESAERRAFSGSALQQLTDVSGDRIRKPLKIITAFEHRHNRPSQSFSADFINSLVTQAKSSAVMVSEPRGSRSWASNPADTMISSGEKTSSAGSI
jgi:hypothetical protein